jgi:hypothetical protein
MRNAMLVVLVLSAAIFVAMLVGEGPIGPF